MTFTYDKTIQGTSGNVENFQVCISKNNGVSWGRPDRGLRVGPACCDDATPCVEDRGRTNGNLFVTIFLDPTVDPAGGMT